MALSDIIKDIERLNKEGIKLTFSSLPNRYDLAIHKHREAANIAINTNINPDHYAVSVANMAFALRHRDNDGKGVLRLLEEVLDKINVNKSYFGTARVLEEKGLVIRHDKERTVETLKDGLVVIEECLSFYERALTNSKNEIAKEEVIRNRLFRTLGIASTIASEIASKHKRLKAYNKCAVSYANEELEMRLENGETKGQDLVNAYHTVGAAITEIVSGKTKLYYDAKKNLTKAQEIAENPLVRSVLNLRFGWLEYKAGPGNMKLIKMHVDAVLADQDKNATKWTSAVKDVLKDKMFALGRRLGKDYIEKIQNMYGA
ncbi:hypothetical protein HYU07_07325 [Candidatus Woesearchaeota archaeon]|nr:hypothetical protein [Candidatus Woesearchaeota archaeon]